MTITSEYIPTLSTAISFKPFDGKNYLLCIDGVKETKLSVSAYSKILLEMINGTKSIKKLTDEFNDRNNTNFSVEQIIEIFNNQLIGYGIFKQDNEGRISDKDSYLSIRFKLIPDWLTIKIASLFIFLFSKNVFTIISIMCACTLGYFFYLKISFSEFYREITPNFLLKFYILNVLGILLHEFGHASACKKFGAKSGAIGFGFYLLTPVFYADVTDAWRLKRSERLIVDLSGIYMQLIFCVVLCILTILTADAIYLNIAFAIITATTININPFLRFDGYWALSDLTGIPNLKSKSNQAIQLFGKSVFRKSSQPFVFNSQNIFLVIYGLISLLSVILFVSYMVFYNRNSVLYFPYNVILFFKTLLTNFSQVKFEWIRDTITSFILPLLFYIFLIKYLWNRKKKFIQLLQSIFR